MTNADVLENVEDAVTTYSDDQQLDAALSEKLARYHPIHLLCTYQTRYGLLVCSVSAVVPSSSLACCRLLESPEKDSHTTAEQVVDTVVASQDVQPSTEHKGSSKQAIYNMLADASPSTPPAGKPSLSPPPPDTPCESSAAGSVSSDKANHLDTSSATAGTTSDSSAKLSTNGSSLHAAARAFVPNVNAPAFVPDTAPKVSAINTANGGDHHGHPNGSGANGHPSSAHSISSPHAAWHEAAYSEAAGYQNGWSGAYNMYGGYNDPYAGYGYGGMTPDGLFIPQQVLDPALTALLQISGLFADCELHSASGILPSNSAVPMRCIRTTRGTPYACFVQRGRNIKIATSRSQHQDRNINVATSISQHQLPAAFFASCSIAYL